MLRTDSPYQYFLAKSSADRVEGEEGEGRLGSEEEMLWSLQGSYVKASSFDLRTRSKQRSHWMRTLMRETGV